MDQKGGRRWSAIREAVPTTTQPNSSLMTFGRCCGDCITLHGILSSCAFDRDTSASNRCATSALPAARSHALTHLGSSSTLQQLHSLCLSDLILRSKMKWLHFGPDRFLRSVYPPWTDRLFNGWAQNTVTPLLTRRGRRQDIEFWGWGLLCAHKRAHCVGLLASSSFFSCAFLPLPTHVLSPAPLFPWPLCDHVAW